jgi:hypothetical protein
VKDVVIVFNSVVVSAMKMRNAKFLQRYVVAVIATIHI